MALSGSGEGGSEVETGAGRHRSLLAYVSLPREMSAFERDYRARLNRLALGVLGLHVPVVGALAWLCEADVGRALVVSAAVAAGAWVAGRVVGNARRVAWVIALAATLMGGLLMHFSRGTVQQQMPFYFFVVLALLVVFADPAVILVGAAAQFAQHAVVYLALTRGVLSDQTSLGAVAMHGLFVVIESVGACFVARTFFDSMVGLEGRVQVRTRELAQRHRETKLMLDNAGQGFATVSPDGRVQPERSAVLEAWLGPCPPGMRLGEWLGRSDPDVGALIEQGFEALAEDALPLELVVDQMPRRLVSGSVTLALSYRPLVEGQRLDKLMLLVSDITAELARERYETELADVFALFEGAMRDRRGLLDFLAESDALVDRVASKSFADGELARAVHTLKGNFSTFGLNRLVSLCHAIEDDLPVAGGDDARLDELVVHWRALSARVGSLFGEGRQPEGVSVTAQELEELVALAQAGRPALLLAHTIQQWRLERVATRLERLASQARGLARRQHKDVLVTVAAGNTRLASEAQQVLWETLGHLVRNAIDHGVETSQERERAGKPPRATLVLSAAVEGDEVVLCVADDGRGVDWERVRERARERGLPHATSADLAEALFHQGLSTRDAVNEVSGRGVGLDAVRTRCEELGGRIRLESETGRFTRVEIRLPRGRDSAPAGHPERPPLLPPPKEMAS